MIILFININLIPIKINIHDNGTFNNPYIVLTYSDKTSLLIAILIVLIIECPSIGTIATNKNITINTKSIAIDFNLSYR